MVNELSKLSKKNMKILFLDQSGNLGGAELSLSDVAKHYRDQCLVGLFADGPFRELLEQQKIPVEVFNTGQIKVSKEDNIFTSLSSISAIIPLVFKVAKTARKYDLIYANTQKAFVIGALSSFLSFRPLVYHLRDILSTEHFSSSILRLAVTLANQFASLVITNSKATQAAFVAAGGKASITTVVYNGFEPQHYQDYSSHRDIVRRQLNLEGKFVVGHFSRLSPWKGQHILIEALDDCPQEVTVLLVGDALFGEQDYVNQLHQQVKELGLDQRVKFLGFRSDVPQLMAACDLITHTSTAPEPFGRVIVEGMLCCKPVVAAAAGGAVELVKHGKTGWLVQPGDVFELAKVINSCYQQPDLSAMVAKQAQLQARERYLLSIVNQQITQLLEQVLNIKN